MSFKDKAQRALALGEIVVTLSGLGQAPPDMPRYLQQQYGDAAKVRLKDNPARIKRLTAPTTKQSTSHTLSRRELKELRGK
ncbi:hypothetical protein ABZ816_31325 [Actinosynnema sp. NPDC047251]|uniref:Uncharacterized protein n=1 Tax=Saccharothrix espanaensis (strain ATCC 51144 / DSM 44229 / JCM 9112 / NBRC 15066 / NRRL 15764) TaxID=1179773 RepID=K0JY47_SACES|nr:hypothetical protein [Saccharothrix espanaensis]CCH32885.1 hypothetical protein BN6_56260 [Saccharothrix espanaensis DSM 44229]